MLERSPEEKKNEEISEIASDLQFVLVALEDIRDLSTTQIEQNNKKIALLKSIREVAWPGVFGAGIIFLMLRNGWL